MVKKNYFLISLFSCLFYPLSVLSQDEINDLFYIYQMTNDSFNRLTIIIGIIAGVFGVFIAGIFIFFAVKQILADKEIKEYKESIKQNKIKFEGEVKKKLEEMNSVVKKAREAEEKIDKANKRVKKSKKPSSKKEKQDFDKLKDELEKLKDEIIYQRGHLSGIVSSDAIYPTGGISASFNPVETTSHFGATIMGSSVPGFCLHCSTYNDFGSNYCKGCGKKL